MWCIKHDKRLAKCECTDKEEQISDLVDYLMSESIDIESLMAADHKESHTQLGKEGTPVEA